MIVNGRDIAQEIRAELTEKFAQLDRPLTLGFVRSGDDLVAQKFVAMKSRTAAGLGIKVVEFPLPAGSDTEAAVAAVRQIASQSDGMLVQMPLAKNIDVEKVLAAVPIEKDVDAMGERSGMLVLTPVTAAMKEIIEREHVSLLGKKAVVIGAGRLVGAPTASWLKTQGVDVSVFTRESGDFAGATKEADLVVLGAGKANILKPEMIKPGVIILDGGTTESEGELAGDADPACAEVASLFTPVPGGIGPISVAMIFKNLFALAKQG